MLRIEDTDQERFVEGAIENLIKTLTWVGIEYDEGPLLDGTEKGDFGPYVQSKRTEIYKKHIEELLKNDHAYRCFCTKERLEEMRKIQEKNKKAPMYDRKCLSLSEDEIKENLKEKIPFVIRQKIPNELIKFKDLIRGNVQFDGKIVDDQILIKSDGFPTYHLANVIDDHLMEITHVIRGEEWLSSLPKHTILYEYFGWQKPLFYHTPNLRNPDKTKLSKRHGHANVDWYREVGFLPEAILNFLSLMGWSHPRQIEDFDLGEFISLFDPKDLKPVGPIFDLTKLEWLNGVWIRKLSIEEIKKRLEEFYKDDKEFSPVFESKHIDLLIGLAQSRMKKLSEFRDLINAPQKQREFSSEEKEAGRKLLDVLENIEHKDWRDEVILNHLKNFRDQKGVSMKTIYFLITGKEQGLPLIETMVKIEGRDQILENLKARVV